MSTPIPVLTRTQQIAANHALFVVDVTDTSTRTGGYFAMPCLCRTHLADLPGWVIEQAERIRPGGYFTRCDACPQPNPLMARMPVRP